MREPTSWEIEKFDRACRALAQLGQAGFTLYLANDTMNLMVGPSHDDDGRQQQEHVRASYHISGAGGGGDW